MENILAIVGRPNVGKSTLFNRLVEERKAIMDNESGITRDRHYGTAHWNGEIFTVVDTGGYVENSKDIFEQAIKNQVKIALEEANAIVWMVNVKEGITPLDREFLVILRKITKPVFLVINKVDSHQDYLKVHEFHALGISSLYSLSAINGSGTGDLLDHIVTAFPKKTITEAAAVLPKIAILGRPNVGKSSLLNVLLKQERNIVTPISGTTRDTIDTVYNQFGKKFILTDTAGIRKKAKVKEAIEFYAVLRSIKALQKSDVCMIILDATQGLEAQDMQILKLAHRYQKGVVILVNKWDLISKDHMTMPHYIKTLQEKIAPWQHIPVIFTSMLTKQRVYQAIDQALVVYQNRKQSISTARLNKVMLEVIERYPPPAYKGKHIKIKYVTQLPTHTPIFAFFCNLPQYVRLPYQRYLENQMRKHFSFEGVPLKLFFRKK